MVDSHLEASVTEFPVERMVHNTDSSSQSLIRILILWGLGFNGALYVEDLDW